MGYFHPEPLIFAATKTQFHRLLHCSFTALWEQCPLLLFHIQKKPLQKVVQTLAIRADVIWVQMRPQIYK